VNEHLHGQSQVHEALKDNACSGHTVDVYQERCTLDALLQHANDIIGSFEFIKHCITIRNVK
jgi:hypothetical protein